MYTITELTKAKEKVERLHGESVLRYNRKPKLDDEYRRIFDIAAASTELQKEGWAYCFSNGEIALLAEYIFERPDRTKEEIDALLGPIKCSGDVKLAGVLYKEWQDNYDNPSYAKIFDFMIENKELQGQFIDKYILQPAQLKDEAKDNNVVIYINKTAAYEGDGSYESFIKMLSQFGIGADTRLYKACSSKFALICDGKTYLNMGAEKVGEFLDGFEGQDRRVMMRNMLRVLDSYQLKMLVSLVPKFNGYLGSSESETYQKVMRKLTKEVQDKYMLWQNQYFIFDVLGHGERAEFWSAYANMGVMRKHDHADIIYIIFDTFTVIEFAESAAAYFFANDYMEEVIHPVIDSLETEEAVEEWIYKNAEWGSDKSHKDHWRKAHVGSWQLDMKSYMSGILKKKRTDSPS